MWIADGACSALTSTLLIVKGYLHPETNTTGLAVPCQVLQFPAKKGNTLYSLVFQLHTGHLFSGAIAIR